MASEYIKYQLKDIKPTEKPPELSPKEKLRNWFYYHKWHIIIGAVLLGILLDVGFHALSQKKHAPDYQIAYVGSAVLPEETVSALTDAFAALGTDENGDGKVLVTLNSYIRNAPGSDSAEAGEYEAASEVLLIGDMEKCESYFFIVGDPERFQKDFQVLAREDGSLPEPTEDDPSSGTDNYYALPVSQCSALADAMSGTYSELVSGQAVSGKNSDYLNSLFLARRGFIEGRECAHKTACDLLWEKIAG